MSVKLASALVPPAMTTTQRDAIPAGRRPPGSCVFNTTTNRLEVNIGTDATPVWSGGTKAERAIVSRSTVFSIPNAAWTVFPWTTVSPTGYYTLGGASSERVIVPEAGVYMFTMSFLIASTAAGGYHRLCGIGRVVSGTAPTSPAVSSGTVANGVFPTGGQGVRCLAVLTDYFAANEYVVGFAFQDSTAAQSTVNTDPNGEGAQIRCVRLGSGP